ncbi:cohesin domain-containing protein, partial [Candidatus Parcubacteria bacterium]|nr:cohesin domain-containing protein [Candidatus Parcubacteria bacterium]
MIKTHLLIATLVLAAGVFPAEAQTVFIDASKLASRVEIYFSPRTGSFVEGSTFDIPILINTRGAKINGLEIKITFDKDKLEVVKPSSGQSIIGVWVEPPSYDNTRGVASYMGVIPNGITTSSGSIGTITFRAKKLGKAVVTVGGNSKVLLNDGQGTEAAVDLGRSEYSILPKAPEGVKIFSETHPFQGDWYNNNSPVVFWDKDPGVAGFSYALDDKPSTVPENTVMTAETTKSFESLDDGLWYFHIKANKNGVWGTTG